MSIRQKQLVGLVLFMAFTPMMAAAQVYTVLSFDPKGDAREPSGDAAQLAYRYDKELN